MFVKGSLTPTESGFQFAIKDTYAPATVLSFGLTVDEQAVPPGQITLQIADEDPVQGEAIGAETPFALPVNQELKVTVRDQALGSSALRLSVETREAGLLEFSIKAQPEVKKARRYPRENIFKRLLSNQIHAEAVVDLDDVLGKINPNIYGHFVEHLENCVYGGIFTPDGSNMNEDVVALVKALKPPLIRYPGGNFVSGYHWEEGIGPKDRRPAHEDKAWHALDPNQVGTDEFMAFCKAVGAEPFLVVNDGSGTPEEAARWVAYCNDPPETAQGSRRAANGHPEPYNVKLWGLGNEVWGDWQIGHTDADGYVARIKPFIAAMRAADPEIKLVAVGLDMQPGDSLGAEEWNRTVLQGLGDRIDYLSFHVYQPDESGYREQYDEEALYHSLIAAPYSTEDAIRRMASLIKKMAPDRQIGVALDEYNVKLPPEPGARSMHDLAYTLRDGLYVAGMLNAFHRQCDTLQIANIALLVNTLPLIVKPADQPAFATPLYFPYQLYSQMEPEVLSVAYWSPVFYAEGLGENISSRNQVPYIEFTATRSADGKRVVLAIANRQPLKSAKVMVNLKGKGNRNYHAVAAQMMTGADPLAANTAGAPDTVGIVNVKPPQVRFAWMDVEIPRASLMVVVLEKKE
jgi:alpha-N-arabinofuranosidase